MLLGMGLEGGVEHAVRALGVEAVVVEELTFEVAGLGGIADSDSIRSPPRRLGEPDGTQSTCAEPKSKSSMPQTVSGNV